MAHCREAPLMRCCFPYIGADLCYPALCIQVVTVNTSKRKRLLLFIEAFLRQLFWKSGSATCRTTCLSINQSINQLEVTPTHSAHAHCVWVVTGMWWLGR